MKNIYIKLPKVEDEHYWFLEKNKCSKEHKNIIYIAIKASHVHKTHKVASAIIAIVRFE